MSKDKPSGNDNRRTGEPLMTDTRGFLTDLLTGYAEAHVESGGRAEPGRWVDRILGAFPQIDDHAGEKGYWNTADEHGNISGPFDSYDEAQAHGHGWPYWCEDDEED
jgi:hypothetical protein